MKLLFLDIDGVLVTTRSMKQFGHARSMDPACVAQLDRILEATDASIVVSSIWRFDVNGKGSGLRRVTEAFIEAGYARCAYHIMGLTPISASGHRATEIHDWLDQYETARKWFDGPAVTNWIQLDDTTVNANKDHLVRTYQAEGLTPAIADEAIARLNRKG